MSTQQERERILCLHAANGNFSGVFRMLEAGVSANCDNGKAGVMAAAYGQRKIFRLLLLRGYDLEEWAQSCFEAAKGTGRTRFLEWFEQQVDELEIRLGRAVLRRTGV